MVGFRLFWDKVRRYLVRNLPLARSLDRIGSDRIGQRNANEITAMTQKSHNRLRNKGLRTGKPNGHTLRSLVVCNGFRMYAFRAANYRLRLWAKVALARCKFARL